MPQLQVSPMNVKRRLFVLFIIFLIVSLTLIARLAWIQIVQADELYERAWEQWNRSIPAQSPRGAIYDRNQELVAGSSTVETIVAIPPRIEDPHRTAEALASVLEMSKENIEDMLTMERAAVYLKRKVDDEMAQEVREMELEGITFTPEGNRVYPRGNLASQILGVVGIDQGWSGLELYYEEELQGSEGQMYFPSDARGEQIPHEIKRFVPPRSGLDLHLTVDETIQHILERELSRAMVEHEARRVMGIAVNPQTGEVLAASSKPDFDPENYSEYEPRNWSLAPVTDSFEPGSTLKLVTLAAAIEEGIYDMEEDFYCKGYKEVAGSRISCWTRDGHGDIDFLEAVQGSCNPAFITLGEKLGKERLFNYLDGFGFGEKSGIDYPGEGEGLIFHPDNIGPVELATSSFGQGVSVTPLQQVMAVSAMANGGYLMEPYLVKEIRDEEGDLIKESEPTVKRQVISEQNSQLMKEIMESVVEEGSGVNAYMEGYRVAGKTGTAQKVGPEGTYLSGDFILSFIGFAPVEDPQVLIYVAVDGSLRGSQWGGQVSAPLFRRIMEDVLSYKEIYPDNTAEPQEVSMVEVPGLVGLSADEAAEVLYEEGLKLEPVGTGEQIVKQTPEPGSRVPLQSRIITYFQEEELSSEETVVPDLKGFTIREARQIAGWVDLDLEVRGSGIAVDQDPPPHEVVNRGEKLVVEFESLTSEAHR